MPDKKIKFARTEQAAKSDRVTKWDVIAAIADDAVEAEIPIGGIESRLAARKAFEAAGTEYEDSTVKGLCSLAKFDYESTASQRKIWRRYGWTSVRDIARAGWSQPAAAALLDGQHKRNAEIQAALRTTRRPVTDRSLPFDDRCAQWVQRANKLMMDGADLLTESEGMAAIGAHAEMALMIYQRISERHLEAEIRRFFETEAVG